MINIEFTAALGQTLGASLFAVNDDVILYDSTSVTEQSNTKGMYLAEFSPDPAEGTYLIVGYDVSSSPPVGVVASYVVVTSAAAVFRSGNYADVVAAASVELMRAIAQNKTVTDPVSGVMTVYADDDVTPLLTAQMYEGVAETQTYRGRGAEVRERLVP